MSRRKMILTILVLSGHLISCFFFLSLSASAVSVQTNATHYCQCVEYVNSYYRMHVPGNAYEWMTNLPDYGWHQESDGTIRKGDIAVWDRYAMPPFGHVAIVRALSDSNQGRAITFLGANQSGSPFPSLHCNNADYWQDSWEWNAAVYFYR